MTTHSSPSSPTDSRPAWQRRLLQGRSWLVVTVLVALAVGLTAGFMVAGGPANPAPTTQKSAVAQEDPEELYRYEATVIIGQKAYEPSYTTVRAHTKVFFENPGTVSDPAKVSATSYLGPVRGLAVNPTSPGSDKGFKGSDVIKPMTDYDYIFNTPGTYTFHDVAHPQMNGTIVVIADK